MSDEALQHIRPIGEDSSNCIFRPGTPASSVQANVHFDNSPEALERLRDALHRGPVEL